MKRGGGGGGNSVDAILEVRGDFHSATEPDAQFTTCSQRFSGFPAAFASGHVQVRFLGRGA